MVLARTTRKFKAAAIAARKALGFSYNKKEELLLLEEKENDRILSESILVKSLMSATRAEDMRECKKLLSGLASRGARLIVYDNRIQRHLEGSTPRLIDLRQEVKLFIRETAKETGELREKLTRMMKQSNVDWDEIQKDVFTLERSMNALVLLEEQIITELSSMMSDIVIEQIIPQADTVTSEWVPINRIAFLQVLDLKTVWTEIFQRGVERPLLCDTNMTRCEIVDSYERLVRMLVHHEFAVLKCGSFTVGTFKMNHIKTKHGGRVTSVYYDGFLPSVRGIPSGARVLEKFRKPEVRRVRLVYTNIPQKKPYPAEMPLWKGYALVRRTVNADFTLPSRDEGAMLLHIAGLLDSFRNVKISSDAKECTISADGLDVGHIQWQRKLSGVTTALQGSISGGAEHVNWRGRLSSNLDERHAALEMPALNGWVATMADGKLITQTVSFQPTTEDAQRGWLISPYKTYEQLRRELNLPPPGTAL